MSRLIGIDFETYWAVKYSLTQMSYEEYLFDERFELQCVGVQINNEAPYIVFGQEEVIRHLQELIPADNDDCVVCHNALFDSSILEWVCDVHPARYICTQAMARLLWPQEKHSLKRTAQLCFPNDKLKRKTNELVNFKGMYLYEFDDEERKAMTRYCLNDIKLTVQCMWFMTPYVPHDELRIIDITIRMFARRPFVVDKPLILAEYKRLRRERADLVRISGVPKHILSSTAQFGPWIVDQGIPFEKVLSPTLKDPDNMKWPVAKDSDEFIQLQEDYPELKPVWDARLNCASNIDITRSFRMLTHSMKNLYNPEGRMGFALQAYGAGTTLRWSGTNRCNGQNLPRDSPIRRCLRAPEGYKVVVHDQSNIESRILGQLSGEEKILRVYRANGDLYAALASDIYGREITKANDPTERFVGKVCVLALGYQAGAARLRRTLALGQFGPPLHLPFNECRRIVTAFRNTFSEVAHLWNVAERLIFLMMSTPEGEVTTFNGFRVTKHALMLPNDTLLRYPKLRRTLDESTGETGVVYWNGKYDAKLYGGKLVENICQAYARVIIARDTLTADELLSGGQGMIALLVHDEIVSVVLNSYAEEYYEQQKRAMVTPPTWAPTMPLDVSGGIAQEYSK